MKKRSYCKPMLHTEAFVPNEYVAACETHKLYGLECDTNAANALEQELGNSPAGGHRDSEGHCGDIDSQHILTNNEGIIEEIYELYEGTTRLDLELVGGNFIGQDIDNLEGQQIKWKTYLTWGRNTYTYNHVGTIQTLSSTKVMS